MGALTGLRAVRGVTAQGCRRSDVCAFLLAFAPGAEPLPDDVLRTGAPGDAGARRTRRLFGGEVVVSMEGGGGRYDAPAAPRDGRSMKAEDHAFVAGDFRLDDRRELAARLGRAGSPPSDAELLLAAYERWGAECADHLRGDFAFVLVDARQRRVLAARDAFGVKTCYYAEVGGVIFFASHARQLLRLERVPRRLREGALLDYLLGGGQSSRRTMFREIRRLAAGSVLSVSGGTLGERRFWAPDKIPMKSGLAFGDAAARARELLGQAVRRRTASSGAPIGLTMSGGLDSTSIAAFASEGLPRSGRSLLAFSYRFESIESCDESPYVEAVARELDFDVEPVPAERLHLLSGDSLFEPRLESPFVGWRPTDDAIYRALASRGGEVLLSGYGGDEVFQGSKNVFASSLLRGDLGVLRRVFEYGRRRGLGRGRAAFRYLLRPILPPVLDRALRSMALRRPEEQLPPWISDSYARAWGWPRRRSRRSGRAWWDPARRAIRGAFEDLRELERALEWQAGRAARHGVDVRYPFLDRDLVEFVLSLPSDFHFDGGLRKRLLREAVRDQLPEAVVNRPSKTRFGPFIDFSLRAAGPERLDAHLRFSRLGELGVVDLGDLVPRVRRFFSGSEDGFGVSLWFLLTAEAWLGHLRGSGDNYIQDYL